MPILFKKGGEIHINPENKGKFTATKKETGKSTEELTHSKNSVTKKRAVFAANAAKWDHSKKKEYGGTIADDIIIRKCGGKAKLKSKKKHKK